MKKNLFLFLLVIAAVFCTVCAVQATEPTDGNGVYTEAVKMTQDGVFASGGKVTANCPACDKTVTWEPLTAISGTTAPHIKTDKHYYLSGDLRNQTYYSFESNSCLHLNGNSITCSARAIYVETDASLNIMGDGTVTGAFENICPVAFVVLK